jgi:Bacteriophage CI repressor helix-turn-helix domain
MKRIFNIWPTVAEMARELDKPYQTVASWKSRGSIPGEFDTDIVRCAKVRGVDLTFEQIALERAKRLSKTIGGAA